MSHSRSSFVSRAICSARRRRTAFLLGLSLLLLGACQDGGPLVPWFQPNRPSADLLDGRSEGGNPFFYFLEPIASAPSTNGTFNPNLSPEVRICEWNGSACGTVLVTFSTEIQVSTTDEHYRANWDTEKNAGMAGETYRIFVSVGGYDLGFADVYVAETAKDLKNASTTQTLALADGRTLPIKFRIEQGAVGHARAVADGETYTCNDCVEEAVQAGTADTVVTPTAEAGALFPAGAIPDSVGEVTVTINRLDPATQPGGRCLPTQLRQAEGCYSFTTEPYIPEFGDSVTVGVCLDPSKDPDRYQLYKYSETTEVLEKLTEATANFVDCSNFTVAFAGEGFHPLVRLAAAGLSNLGRLISPGRLYAGDSGVGGSLLAFSDFGWVETLEVEMVTATDSQSATVGTVLPAEPQVRVWAAHSDDSGLHSKEPAEGIAVVFQVTAGGGNVGGLVADTVVTDSSGYASVPWTMGATHGAQTLVAVAGDTSVTFHAVALAATGSITAQVTVDGDPYPGAQVTATGSGPSYTALSNVDATAYIPNLALETYSVTATVADSFVVFSPQSVTLTGVAPNQTVTLAGVTVSVAVSPSTHSITPGGTVQLTATVTNSTAGVTWTSDNPAVATVDGSGLVTALVPGTASITATTVEGSASATATITVSSGPVSHWSADTDFDDMVGPNDSPTIQGTVLRTPGLVGNAFEFDGGSIAASGIGTDSVPQVTLMAWVNLGTQGLISGVQRFITLEPDEVVLRVDGAFDSPAVANSLHFYVRTSTGDVGLYADGVLSARSCYYLVAGTYDGSTLNVYVNGGLVASQSHVGALNYRSGVLMSNHPSESLAGSLDEVKIYDRALSGSEISDIYAAAGAGKC